MRVAVVGLGDIAQKAYLPVLTAEPGLELVLVTRDERRLAELTTRHRVSEGHRTVGQALARGLDAAFVHTATAAHRPVVTALLQAGVPTYVDKPLDDSYDGAAELVALAGRRQVSLLVGFNRRWAPAYRDLAGWDERDVVLLQKHRAGSPDDPRRVVFDDFIHVLDTLRFLLDGLAPAQPPAPAQDEVVVTVRSAGTALARVAVQLVRGQRLAVGVMDRTSGLTEEVLEVLAPGRRRRVVDLGDVTDMVGAECTTRRGSWTPVAVQRGFAQLCAEFLGAVREGRLLDASDALVTHELCERVVRDAEEALAAGGAP